MFMRLMLLSLAGWASLVVPSTTLAWQVNVNGPANDDDKAWAVTVDRTGDVVAGGSTRIAGQHADFTVVRLDGRSGRELWRRAIKGPAQADGLATAIAMDRDGNVVAAGSAASRSLGADFTVVKLSGATGAELWRRVLSGPAEAKNVAAVAVDAAGDVIAADYVENNDGAPELTVVKLDGASGVERWRRLVTDGWNAGREEIERQLTVGLEIVFAFMSSAPAVGLKVDASGNVAVAGFTLSRESGSGFTVVKLNGASGAELWRRVIHGNAGRAGVVNPAIPAIPPIRGANVAHAVAVDGAGNVLAAGTVFNTGTREDFIVVKLAAATGAELWRRVINGTGNAGDSANAIAVDTIGNVLASGCIDCFTSPRAHLTVVKLNGVNGAERWRRVVGGTDATPVKPVGGGMEQRQEAITAVAVNPDGDAFAVGRIVNTGTGSDFTVVKLAGATGAVRWRRVINGSAKNSDDRAHAVAVDDSGNVIAAGVTDNTRTRFDFTVVKLRGADGESAR